MISRRAFSAGTASFALWPVMARALPSRLDLQGTFEQGSLVVGQTDPRAIVRLNQEPLSLTPDGHFAFGFEYDRASAGLLTALFPDGGRDSRTLQVQKRQYEIQKINGLPEAYVSPPADILARIAGEHARVAEARKVDSAMPFFAEKFDWPATGIISGVFGSRRVLDGVASAPHFGVDIAGGEGAPIRAPANGRVALADQFFLEGGYTLLDHGHGVFTGYMHQSIQLVKTGDAVTRGQPIGNIGHTGRATGPHLHWQMNWFQVRLDPSCWTVLPAPARA